MYVGIYFGVNYPFKATLIMKLFIMNANLHHLSCHWRNVYESAVIIG